MGAQCTGDWYPASRDDGRRTPFRAEHIGSFLRPPELLAARRAFDDGAIATEALREIEDREYDSPRAGSFEPLRRVVLGLVSTKTPALEPIDVLRARVDEAARHVSLEPLALSPQCGFASTAPGNPLTPAEQEPSSGGCGRPPRASGTSGPGRGTGVAVLVGMSEDPASPAPSERSSPVHQFTVNRGMHVVLVIETTSWYTGLLQAAVARIALEGQN